MLTTTILKIPGTRSFRASATQVKIGKLTCGSNLQNNNELLSRCLAAPAGWKLVQVDQRSAEALVVAYLAKPGKFRKLFDVGIKPHTYMALQIFINQYIPDSTQHGRFLFADPVKLAKYPEWPELNKRIKNNADHYALGKRVIHAGNYDMRWPTFKDYCLSESEGQVKLTNDQAKSYLEMRKLAFPEIAEWQVMVADRAYQDRVLYNLFGHPRRITRPWDDGLRREILSFIPQSTVGELTHIAFTNLYDWIAANAKPWHLLNNKHDSYVAMCPESEALECARKMICCMARTFTTANGETFTMGADPMIGQNLGKWHETENPEGMREVDV